MTTTPFLGCKISLISKSEIRYEGILYTIDPKESTIALAKVRSYGTEDRSAERQVPPREEIFEYIIFRAGDIKDLIVDDPPASIAPGLADPAIIQAHSTSTNSGATFPSTTFPQMTTSSSISATTGQRSTVPAFGSGGALNSLVTGAVNSSNSIDSRSQNSTPTGGQQHRHSPQNDGTNAGQAVKHTPNKENQRRNTGDRGPQPQNFRRGGGGGGGGGGGQQSFHQNYSHQPNRRGSGQQNFRQNQGYPQSQPSGNRFGGSAAYNRQFNNYSSGGRRPQSRPQQRGSQNRMPNRAPKEPLKFDSDYDFDKANHEFKELEEKFSNIKLDATANSDVPPESDKQNDTENKPSDMATNGVKEMIDSVNSDHFYDKTKSFFDTISCEALEREKGNVQRIDWKAERKLNSETFGVPLSYRFRGFGRGRGGYNYRGYSQGFRNRGGFGRGVGGGDTRRFNGPPRNPRNNN